MVSSNQVMVVLEAFMSVVTHLRDLEELSLSKQETNKNTSQFKSLE